MASDLVSLLLSIFQKYEPLGHIEFANGTRSIGKLPDKEKWFLIHIYGGLDINDIQKMEKYTKYGFSEALMDFYRAANGMTLFGAGQIQFWGLRTKARLDMPNYQPVPFDTAHQDTFNMFINVPDDAVFFGTYCGEYYFYNRKKSAQTYLCKSPDATPIKSWNSIDEMVLNLAEKMTTFFNEDASPINKNVLYSPVLLGD